MRENWEMKTVGELFSITDYVSNGSFATLKQNVTYYYEPNYAILVRLADYSNKFDSRKFVYTDQKGYDFLKKSKLEGGEIIMSNVGSIGSFFICPKLDKPMTLAPNTICINTPNNSFYSYYFLSDNFKNILAKITTQTTLPKFNKTNLKLQSVPVPPLAEQTAIVEKLDLEFAKIDLLKNNAQKQLDEAKALFQSTLKQLLQPKEGWEEKTLGEIGQTKIGPFGSLLHKEDYVTNGVPLINPMHIIDGNIVPNMQYSVGQKKMGELQSYVLRQYDIVIGRRGEMGRCAVVGKNEDGYLCGTGSIFFRPNKNIIDSTFLQIVISSNDVKKKLKKVASGTTMLNLNSKVLNELSVLIPSLDEQRSIVEKLDAISSKIKKLEENYKNILIHCDDLKQAILREIFG